MKTSAKFVCVILLVCAGTGFTPAGRTVYSEESGRIAYIDLARAINEVSDGRSAKHRLEEEFKEKQQSIDKLKTELSKQKDEIDHDRLLTSDDAIKERDQKYRQKFMEFQSRVDGYKQEMAAKEADITKDIVSKIKGIVQKIGDERGYSLVVEKSQELVLYAPKANDITDDVISAYDSKPVSSKNSAKPEKSSDSKKNKAKAAPDKKGR